MTKGFVIMAQGDDYVKLLCVRKQYQKVLTVYIGVTIVTTKMLPYGDHASSTNWKLQNDWQVYEVKLMTTKLLSLKLT